MTTVGAILCTCVAAWMAAAPTPAASPAPTPAGKAPAAGPRLVTTAGRTRLEVQGRPFLMIGGELANSSASSLPVAKAALAKLPAIGLNTVLVPVSWELVEPAEGKLDFGLVTDIVREARRLKLRLVLL